MITWLFQLGAIALVAAQVSASSPPDRGVSVRVVIATESAPEALSEIVLRAEPVEPTAELEVKALELDLRAPWRSTLDLDRAFAWQLSLEADGFWAPEATVQPADENVVLTLFPTGLLTSSLTLTAGEPMPAETAVELSLAPGSQSPPGQTTIAPTTFRCPVVKAQWACEVPSGQLDLRVSAVGFTPHYFWDTSIEPREINHLGTLVLTRGASLAGWITLAQPGPDQTPVQVVLERQVSGWQGNPRERQRLAAFTLRGRANDRGFFQLQGIPAAGYRLSIEKRGFAPAKIPDLTIKEFRETFLEDPIVLFPPATLEVVIEPPVDPTGRFWLVTLGQLEPGSAVLTDRVKTTPALEGDLRITDLESGSFLLKVDDGHGSTWVSRWIEVEPEMSPIFVDVPVVPVEGRVTSGGEPVRTTVAFGSTQGAVQIEMRADVEGRFEGFLPREGRWPVDLVFEDKPLLHQAVDPVEIRKRPGKRAAIVEIALADTLLTGQVLAEDEPAPGANLAILRQGEDRRREAILKTDEEGEFEMRGLSPGTLLIKAYKGKLSTSWQHLDLLEDRDPRLRLVLRRKVELSGLVLSTAGEVPGAEVAAVPQMADGSAASLARALSNFDGSFTLELPAGTVAVDLIVAAPGYAVQIRRLQYSSESSEPAILHVDANGGALVLVDQPLRSSALGNQGHMLHHGGAAVSLDLLIQLLVPKMKVGSRAENLALLGLAAGEYKLCSTSRGCDTGFLPPDGELSLGREPTLAESP